MIKCPSCGNTKTFHRIEEYNGWDKELLDLNTKTTRTIRTERVDSQYLFECGECNCEIKKESELENELHNWYYNYLNS